MQRLAFFILISFICSCSVNNGDDGTITEDNLEAYKKRDSLLNVIRHELDEKNKETATVNWAGTDNCNYLILKTANWYYVAQNNYSGGAYKNDNIKGTFVEYGNMEAYNITSSNSLSLFIIRYYSTRQQAIKYIQQKCGAGNDAFEN
jgi:hypothetical protein